MNNVKKNIQKNEFTEIISRLKTKLGVKNDNKIAELLELTPTSFAERKKRNSVPVDKIKILCIKKSINVNEILKEEKRTAFNIEEPVDTSHGQINETSPSYSIQPDCRADPVCKEICRVCMTSPDDKTYLKMLADILTSHREGTKKAIRQNLEQFYELVKVAAGGPPNADFKIPETKRVSKGRAK